MADPDLNPSTQIQPQYGRVEKHVPRKERQKNKIKNKIKNKYR